MSWLPLLRDLTRTLPEWFVWKNAARALDGSGDLDSFTPREAWPVVEEVFRAWAERMGHGPVVVCRHFGSVPILIVLPPGHQQLLELDVRERKVWKGYEVFSVRNLISMTEVDALGYRRLRPGAEGVVKLALNGPTSTFGENRQSLRERKVAELLRADPEGVEQACRLFGPAAGMMRRLAERVAEGQWSRVTMGAVVTGTVLRGMTDPRTFAQRARFRRLYRRTVRGCPVLSTIFEADRHVNGEREEWLDRAVERHRPAPTG